MSFAMRRGLLLLKKKKKNKLQELPTQLHWLWLVQFAYVLGAYLKENTNLPSAGAMRARNFFASGMKSNMLSAKGHHLIV